MQPVTKLNEDTLRERLLGLMPRAGQTITAHQSRDEAMDTIRTLRSVSLWQTPHDNQGLRELLSLLDGLLETISYQDAGYWIGRALQHFPSRQTERDAVIISDIASDLEGLSHCAVINTLDEIRTEATSEKPFLPPSGEIVSRVKKLQGQWSERLKSATGSKPLMLAKPLEIERKVVPWVYKTYSQVLQAGLLDQVISHCQEMTEDKRKAYVFYLKDAWNFPVDFMRQVNA